MERRSKLRRPEWSFGRKSYRGTNDQRCGVMHNIAQQSGMCDRAGGAGVAGYFGIVGVDVDRLDGAGEGDQQHAQRAEKPKTLARARGVS
jgi:hypothetical protein